MSRRLKVQPTLAGPAPNGLVCSDCGKDQFDTPSGTQCAGGDHGGVPGISQKEWDAKRAKVAATSISEELAETLETTAKEIAANRIEVAKAGARMRFGSANAAKKSDMRPDFVAFVETIWVDDIAVEGKRLVEELRLGELRSDYGSVIKALDNAEDNARKANALYVTAVREREAWEKRNEFLFAGMKVEANAHLQKEKDKGQRNKAITDGDLASACALLFGDEWVSQEKERKDYELAEKHVKNLSERWDSRCKTLAGLAAKLR